ncbi:hypothetical protein D0Z03_002309 [Geotrichum reessii]|nr:hypothetical protein D0Z03_002309 [Galactomyces reessii]
MRSASFSAASAHSYAKVKDIADIDAAQPSDGPNQVGFATPQLYPINDFDIPFDDMFFNQSDAMFINPELLDPSFDNILLANESSPDSNIAANGAVHPPDNKSTLTLNYSAFNQAGLNHIPNSPPLLETDDWLEFNQAPIDPLTMLNFDQFQTPVWDPQQQQEQQQPQQQQQQPQQQKQQQQQQQHQSQHQPPMIQQVPRPFRITPELCNHISSTLTVPTPFSSEKSPFLPPLGDLQRYIDTYIKNFDTHFPFLHHSMKFTNENAPLALSMAAIGALYLSESEVSENIFDISRCCVHVYLESRRERKQNQQLESTPVWLVQTLLLGVVYGLFNEEILANQIAVAQANAVISLAKSAGLQNPSNLPIPGPMSTVQEKWDYFIQVQTRIRTMHVVHIISCLLATGYNVTSSLRNADLKCGSPCDEKLWTAQTANNWWLALQKKESEGSLNNAIEGPDFTESLDRLLSGNTIVNEISQFTLLTLIYAIHLDIHQHRLEYGSGVESTRWLDLEKRRVEAMLRAWETTWSLSPHASLIPRTEDGSLMSDSIPMSSLAHVRLYLDLRKTKECFWKRDFAAMGLELDKIQAPTIVDPITIKPLNTLLEAASYAADTISLWEKHVSRWTLHGTTMQIFIHNIIALFDCGLIVSEFFFRLEKRGEAQWANDERVLVGRLRKIFNRAFDALGMEDATRDTLHAQIEPSASGTNGFGSANTSSGRLELDDTKFPLSVMALTGVSRILSSLYIWPYANVMGAALDARMAQIKALC